MPEAGAIAEVFGLLQAGRAEAALSGAQRLLAANPADAASQMAAGMALRMLGRVDEARAALRRAIELRPSAAAGHAALGELEFGRGDWAAAIEALESAVALDPSNAAASINLGLAYAESGQDTRAEKRLRETVERFAEIPDARHALGWALHKARRTAEALPHYETAIARRDDPRWRLDLAKALADAGDAARAREEFGRALERLPGDAGAMVAFGRFCVAQGDFDRAAELFAEAGKRDPQRLELSMYLAQVELARGRWRDGWRAYARREQRVLYEAESLRRGRPYRLPDRAELAGRLVLIAAEQGLGDELFFLRFAPQLRGLGARLAYAGDARLFPLLARTGLFESFVAAAEPGPAGAVALLSGDLPLLLESESTPGSLRIAPDPARLEAMRRRLERVGPRPWVGVTWRAGTPRQLAAHALQKAASIPGLFAAMPRVGTVISLQRDGHFDELESASNALQRPIYDFSTANADLDEALALVALLDAHVGVSNTNMHLAAAAGATADVLVPFPPEWRWGLAGESRWFPGFRVYRQSPDGDWSRAYAVLAQRMARQ